MKRIVSFFLAAVCLLSLAACGSKKPSLEEVEQAINEGTLTLEDAVGKGYVTQDWADEYIESRTVPAGDKMEAGAIGEFTTTTLAGEEFTREQLEGVVLFAFIDPAGEEAEAFYQALVEGYEGVKENGAGILVCAKGEEGNELFEDAPFPVIPYDDAVKAATKNHSGMIEDLDNSASWCVNGSFYSAWYSVVDAESLADSAAGFVEVQKEMAEGGENGGIVVMGSMTGSAVGSATE